jgi:hypothetical protein
VFEGVFNRQIWASHVVDNHAEEHVRRLQLLLHGVHVLFVDPHDSVKDILVANIWAL